MSSPFPAFSDSDYEELADWLPRRRQGIFDIIELEGLLTAIAIGPNTLNPRLWLAKVWGGKTPKFRDLEEANRFTTLVMGYFNDLVAWFEHDPEGFQPTFYERKVGKKKYLIVEEWCLGFLKGMRLDTAGWKPLKTRRPDLLKPLTLFGTPKGWEELDAGGDAKMHALWSPRIAPAVRGIHAFWIPYRIANYRDQTGERVH